MRNTTKPYMLGNPYGYAPQLVPQQPLAMLQNRLNYGLLNYQQPQHQQQLHYQLTAPVVMEPQPVMAAQQPLYYTPQGLIQQQPIYSTLPTQQPQPLGGEISQYYDAGVHVPQAVPTLVMDYSHFSGQHAVAEASFIQPHPHSHSHSNPQPHPHTQQQLQPSSGSSTNIKSLTSVQRQYLLLKLKQLQQYEQLNLRQQQIRQLQLQLQQEQQYREHHSRKRSQDINQLSYLNDDDSDPLEDFDLEELFDNELDDLLSNDTTGGLNDMIPLSEMKLSEPNTPFSASPQDTVGKNYHRQQQLSLSVPQQSRGLRRTGGNDSVPSTSGHLRSVKKAKSQSNLRTKVKKNYAKVPSLQACSSTFDLNTDPAMSVNSKDVSKSAASTPKKYSFVIESSAKILKRKPGSSRRSASKLSTSSSGSRKGTALETPDSITATPYSEKSPTFGDHLNFFTV